MMNWILSANSKMYDHSSAFEHFGFIDWKQGNIKYSIGDIVYIYCTSPLQMIQYKCIIEKTDIEYRAIAGSVNTEIQFQFQFVLVDNPA